MALILATGSVPSPAWACGLEGGLGDALSAAYEGSLDVAFATHDAIARGWLVPDAQLAAEATHERADERLRMLAAQLPVASRGAKSFAVLMVESGVWTRVSAKAGKWSLAMHVDKPASNEVVVLVSEPALRNLVSGQLAADDAVSNGLLAVHGKQEEQGHLMATLRQAFPYHTVITAHR